jgi:Putative DNA-binding domain
MSEALTIADPHMHARASPQQSSKPVPGAVAVRWTHAKPGRRAAGVPSRIDGAAHPINILARRFPVIRRLVGDESFRAMARRYLASEPARFTLLHAYGDSFPRFLSSQGDSASFEYVADIAELELGYDKAQRAGRSVSSQQVTLLSPAQLFELGLVLHPSVSVVASRFPIVAIWEGNRRDDRIFMIERWIAESALVARPFLQVEVRRLPPGGYPFIAALLQGQSLSAAAGAASAVAPDFDFGSGLTLLMESNIVMGCRERLGTSGENPDRRAPR